MAEYAQVSRNQLSLPPRLTLSLCQALAKVLLGQKVAQQQQAV